MNISVKEILQRIESVIRSGLSYKPSSSYSRSSQNQLSRVLHGEIEAHLATGQPITRVYIRSLVQKNLIKSYQNPEIVDAVTNVLWAAYRKD